MKKLVFLIVSILLGFQFTVAQSDCSKYYPFEEGAKFQITNYNKNDKVAGVIDYVVTSSTGDTATLSYEMRDDKGDIILSSEYGISCDNDGISIDFNSLAAPGMLEQYQDMEVDISGTNLHLPNDLSPGQMLPDADMLMNISMAPINMKMTVNIFNRMVEANETITTPAGTFDCTVISYDMETKMGMKITGRAKQWLAQGVGMVQQINYNKNGKEVGKSVLTAFNN